MSIDPIAHELARLRAKKRDTLGVGVENKETEEERKRKARRRRFRMTILVLLLFVVLGFFTAVLYRATGGDVSPQTDPMDAAKKLLPWL